MKSLESPDLCTLANHYIQICLISHHFPRSLVICPEFSRGRPSDFSACISSSHLIDPSQMSPLRSHHSCIYRIYTATGSISITTKISRLQIRDSSTKPSVQTDIQNQSCLLDDDRLLQFETLASVVDFGPRRSSPSRGCLGTWSLHRDATVYRVLLHYTPFPGRVSATLVYPPSRANQPSPLPPTVSTQFLSTSTLFLRSLSSSPLRPDLAAPPRSHRSGRISPVRPDFPAPIAPLRPDFPFCAPHGPHARESSIPSLDHSKSERRTLSVSVHQSKTLRRSRVTRRVSTLHQI
jgi:hypothetical protein